MALRLGVRVAARAVHMHAAGARCRHALALAGYTAGQQPRAVGLLNGGSGRRAGALLPVAPLAAPAHSVLARGLKVPRRQTRKRPPSKYKLKTKKAVAHRFYKRTATGLLKFGHRGRIHNSSAQSKKALRQKRRPKYATGKLLRNLNRMLINR